MADMISSRVDHAFAVYRRAYVAPAPIHAEQLLYFLTAMTVPEVEEYYRRVLEFRHAMARAKEDVEWPR